MVVTTTKRLWGHNHIILSVVSATIITSLVSYWAMQSDEQVANVVDDTLLVNIMKVYKQTQSPMISLHGKAKLSQPLVGTVNTSGTVVKLMIKPGMHIVPGQAIMQIEKPATPEYNELLANIEHVNNEVKKAELELGTFEKQFNILTKEVVNKASNPAFAQTIKKHTALIKERKSSIQLNKTKLTNMQEELRSQQQSRLTTITAYKEGIIEKVLISDKQMLQTNDSIYVLKLHDNIFVEATIPDNTSTIIRRALDNKVNLKAKVYNAKTTYSARLTSLYTANDGRSTQVKVSLKPSSIIHLADDEADKPLLVRLALPQIPNSYTLPEDAIYHGDRVYSVNSDKILQAHRVKIVGKTINNEGQPYIIVRSKDNLNDRNIMVSKQAYVLSGMRVEVNNTTKN